MHKPIQVEGLLVKSYQLLQAGKEVDYKGKVKWENEFNIQINAQ